MPKSSHWEILGLVRVNTRGIDQEWTSTFREKGSGSSVVESSGEFLENPSWRFDASASQHRSNEKSHFHALVVVEPRVATGLVIALEILFDRSG